MIDRIRIDEIKAALGCESVLFGADYGNSEVRSLPLHLAPPPPSEEKAFINPHSKSKGMDFAAALRNDSDRKARERAELRAALAEFAPKRAPHPNKIQGVPPCPNCGSNNTWSKHKNRNGTCRRMCKEPECGKSYTFEVTA